MPARLHQFQPLRPAVHPACKQNIAALVERNYLLTQTFAMLAGLASKIFLNICNLLSSFFLILGSCSYFMQHYEVTMPGRIFCRILRRQGSERRSSCKMSSRNLILLLHCWLQWKFQGSLFFSPREVAR